MAHVYRGVIVDAISGAPLERLEDLVLCSECVVGSAVLIDPDAPDGTGEIEAEKERLRLECESAAKVLARVKREIKEDEQRLAGLVKERDALDALRATAGAWRGQFADAVNGFREQRTRSYAAEYAASQQPKGSGAAKAAAEARARLKAADRSLRALARAGRALGSQCEGKGLYAETSLIRERIDTELGDVDEF